MAWNRQNRVALGKRRSIMHLFYGDTHDTHLWLNAEFTLCRRVGGYADHILYDVMVEDPLGELTQWMRLLVEKHR